MVVWLLTMTAFVVTLAMLIADKRDAKRDAKRDVEFEDECREFWRKRDYVRIVDDPPAESERASTMTNPMIVRAKEVAEELRGTTKSLSNVATDEETNDATFCAELDSHVFQCECCGWWCSDDEGSCGSDQVCYDCNYDRDDEDARNK
jgi:hypothetical protein